MARVPREEEYDASPLKEGEVECPECGRRFTSNQALGAHRAAMHGYRRANKPVPDATPAVASAQDAPPDDQGTGLPGRWVLAEDGDDLDELNGITQAQNGYEDKLFEFLPALARELQRRRLESGPDDGLTAVFLTLYLDAT